MNLTLHVWSHRKNPRYHFIASFFMFNGHQQCGNITWKEIIKLQVAHNKKRPFLICLYRIDCSSQLFKNWSSGLQQNMQQVILQRENISAHFVSNSLLTRNSCVITWKLNTLINDVRSSSSVSRSRYSSQDSGGFPQNIKCYICPDSPVYLTPDELLEHEKSEKHHWELSWKRSIHCNLCRFNFNSDHEAFRYHMQSDGHQDNMRCTENSGGGGHAFYVSYRDGFQGVLIWFVKFMKKLGVQGEDCYFDLL